MKVKELLTMPVDTNDIRLIDVKNKLLIDKHTFERYGEREIDFMLPGEEYNEAVLLVYLKEELK